MSKLLFKKTPMGLQPQGDDSVTVFNSIKMDEEVLIDYKRHRNVQHHKKLFAMLGLIKDNQSQYKTVESILIECKYRAEYYNVHISQNGEQILIPKSVNFASLGKLEFEKFYSSAIDTCLQLVPMGKEELENAVLRFC